MKSLLKKINNFFSRKKETKNLFYKNKKILPFYSCSYEQNFLCIMLNPLISEKFKYYLVITTSMGKKVQISILEKVIINSFSPLIYVLTFGHFPFKEITQLKEEAYLRLVEYQERDGKIPSRVQEFYCSTICGSLAVGTAHIRKYLK